VAAIRTRAVRDGDHYVINGSKMFITNGATADIVFLAARVGAARRPAPSRHLDVPRRARDARFTVSRTLDKMGMRASDTASSASRHARPRGEPARP